MQEVCVCRGRFNDLAKGPRQNIGMGPSFQWFNINIYIQIAWIIKNLNHLPFWEALGFWESKSAPVCMTYRIIYLVRGIIEWIMSVYQRCMKYSQAKVDVKEENMSPFSNSWLFGVVTGLFWEGDEIWQPWLILSQAQLNRSTVLLYHY